MPGSARHGAKHPDTSGPRAQAPSLWQQGTGQGHCNLRVLLRQQRESHKLREWRPSPIYLSTLPRQRLEHTALPPSCQEVVFTVSSLKFPREQCSPARGEKEKPICPQRGGAGHELGLPGAVSALVFAAVNVCGESCCCTRSGSTGEE